MAIAADARAVAAAAPSRPPAALLLAAFALVAVMETLIGWRTIPADGLLDPDSYMRVVRLRDMLRSGTLTHVVAADNGGLGTVVYWSHLIDGFVLLLAAPLRLWFDPDEALRLGAAWTGPLTAGCLAAALAWAPAPLARPRWLWLAPVAGFTSASLLGYGLFGWVHHHLPLILTSVMAAGYGGRAATGDARAGLWCGVWSALGMWLSPEALAYDLLAIGAVVAGWCVRPARVGRPLLATAFGFLAVLAAATLADPPEGSRWSPDIDCLSVAYVVLAALLAVAAVALVMVGRGRITLPGRAAAATIAGAGAVGVWLAIYPAVTRGLGGLVPAADVAAYFGAISEMHPVSDVSSAVEHLLRATLAVVMAVWLGWRERSLLWAYAALGGAAVVLLGAAFIRFFGYAEALGAMAAPVAMSVLFGPGEPGRLWRIALLAVILIGPSLPGTLQAARSAPAAVATPCNVADIAPALRALPGAVVLTGIGDTPEVLWRTPVRTVGSLYHRSIGAFVRARDAWRTPPSATVPDAVRATGAAYVLACEQPGRGALIADLPADTLMDRLARHQPPPWLREVANGGAYHVYQIAP